MIIINEISLRSFFTQFSAQQNAVEGLERHLRALEEKRRELLEVDSKRLVGNIIAIKGTSHASIQSVNRKNMFLIQH